MCLFRDRKDISTDIIMLRSCCLLDLNLFHVLRDRYCIFHRERVSVRKRQKLYFVKGFSTLADGRKGCREGFHMGGSLSRVFTSFEPQRHIFGVDA